MNANEVKIISDRISNFALQSSIKLPPPLLHFCSNATDLVLAKAFKSLQKKLAVGDLSPSTHQTAKSFKSYAETCASILRRCSDRRMVPGGLALHAHTIKSGISSDRSVSTKLLTMYSDWGRLTDRDRVFDEAGAFDLFSWNFMIGACVRSGNLERADNLFERMPERDAITWTVMVDGHMKHGRVHDSIGYFERSPFRTVVSWTALISGFVHNGLNSEALMLFCQMLGSGLMPNDVTFTCVIRACIGGCNLDLGRSVVSLIVKTNFERNMSVCNSLITLHLRTGDVALASRVFDEMDERDVVSWTALLDVYVEMGDLKEARRVFDEMPERNEVSWSTMVARYGQNGESVEALRLFNHMLHDGYKPNISCLSSALSASASLENLPSGISIHCHVIKIGFERDVFIVSSLIDLYCNSGKSEDGRRVFDLSSEKNIVCWNSMIAGYSYDSRIEEADELFKKMPVRNIASWNAIISGHVKNGQFGKALAIFDDMLISGQLPISMTFSSVLLACARLPSLEKGKNLHGKTVKLGIQREVYIGTALTDFYAKSGDVESSKRVFYRMPKKNEVSWTAMMQGLADSGLAQECLILFEEMKSTSIAPTEPMFLSVLFACSHCGLVDKGFQYFESMVKDYDIPPKEKHYTCMVDLLARAGHLREAEEFISTMPIEPEADSWAALLSGCSSRRNEEIGERAARRLWELEKGNPASYVLLSNIYASVGRWKDVAKVRALMREAGLKKGGGCSWIQIRDRVDTFFSWDAYHPKSVEIYGVLEHLMSEIMA